MGRGLCYNSESAKVPRRMVHTPCSDTLALGFVRSGTKMVFTGCMDHPVLGVRRREGWGVKGQGAVGCMV